MPRYELRKIRERWIAQSLAWGMFLVLSLIVLVSTLARMAAAGPAGSSHPSNLQSFAGAVKFVGGVEPLVTAPAAFVYDPDMGFIYYSKNANQELPMASCTKIMTALLAVERGNLNQLITIGPDAAALASPGNSYMGVSNGEKYTLRDLLYGLMLPSGNDAAIAISDAIAGSVPAFVALMNQRAQQLGLTHTHFENPHGLNAPGHYTTAHDLATLAAAAMNNPTLVQITSTAHYSIPKTDTHKAIKLETGDDLLAYARSPYPGAIGVKPGFTGEAGYCQAFAAIRHGHKIIGVVLGEPSWEVRIVDMRNLLDWGFKQEGIPAAPTPIPWSAPSPNA